MKRFLLVIIALTITSSLIAQQFSITAKLTGFKNGTKFYIADPELESNIDSAVINNNTFVIKAKLDYAPKSIFISTTEEGKYYWCFLFIGNEKVQLKGDKKDFPFYLQISGSKSQDIYSNLNNITRELSTKRNLLTENLGSLLADESDSAEKELKSLGKQLNYIDSIVSSKKMEFIQSNLNTYPGLNELYYLRNRYNRDSLQQMYQSLQSDYKESVYGERILNFINVGDPLKVGEMYADFEASDQNGQFQKLSSFLGKYILLDFTSTNCGPCIFSIDELKKISEEYSDSLNIISFSADNSKEVWEKGLKRDSPIWPCLWDGKGAYSEIMLKYGVTGYPTFFLINPDGKIVSKWSGYGKNSLLKRVAKFINKKDNER